MPFWPYPVSIHTFHMCSGRTNYGQSAGRESWTSTLHLSREEYSGRAPPPPSNDGRPAMCRSLPRLMRHAAITPCLVLFHTFMKVNKGWITPCLVLLRILVAFVTHLGDLQITPYYRVSAYCRKTKLRSVTSSKPTNT